jgi:hypothetical protein
MSALFQNIDRSISVKVVVRWKKPKGNGNITAISISPNLCRRKFFDGVD